MQTWAQVLTRARGGCVVHRCQNKNSREKIVTGGMWMTSCTGNVRGGFWEIWEKSVELGSWLGRRRLTFACSPKPDQWPCVGCVRDGVGADGKVSIERLCLSPYVEKPLNSKVIKSVVPGLRSRKCFSCFGIPMFYVYMLWTFYERFTYPGIMGMLPQLYIYIHLNNSFNIFRLLKSNASEKY